MEVPLLDLRQQYALLREEIRAKFDQIADSQRLILGPEVETFEANLARFTGAHHAIGVSSGTDAQLVVLMALDIGKGDSVITTPYTFFATAGAIARVGARPIFVDIDPSTFNISPKALEQALQKSGPIKAIIPVHLFGCCADMIAILEIANAHNVPVLEDAAQALGARHPRGGAGAMGEAGWFSFYPTKNLGAFGDAGMVVCRDSALSEKIRALRNHGMQPQYHHKWIGGNFRIDALQAAILNIKLPHLDAWAAARREHAAFYRQEFVRADLGKKLQLPAEPFAGEKIPNHHIYNQFVIRAPQRDELREYLRSHHIGSEIYYPVPSHLQECFRYLGYKEGDFPASERAARETLALPIYPELTVDQQSYVVETIRHFYQ